ncbi:MAG: DUF4105 domain-containing protein [Pseudomonadota bacterium]|nr:DUF4105 domain-containing protein [Pseudomonadota bacterium]
MLIASLSPISHAGVADAPGANLRVDLYTYGSGAIYWERFGHDALIVTDTASGESYAFNYGLFDFNQQDFFLNFARGHMSYMAAAWPAADDLAQYEGEGRWIVTQQLNLTPQLRARLRDFLVWNVQPKNARYAYDYYTQNCTTRIRDALDRVLGGTLRGRMQPQTRAFTYRSQTDRLMAGQPWLMLVLDLGLGSYADQPLNGWNGSFLPTELMESLRGVRVTNGQPLVISETQIATARLPAAPKAPPDLRWPLLIAGLMLGAALAFAGSLRTRCSIARYAFAVGGALFALLAGIAGWLMAILWAFTAHRAAWANENLLLFDPLALLLIPGLLRLARDGTRGKRFTIALTMILTVLAAFALLSKALPRFPQQNLPWILFALPLWLGLLYGLWRNRST